MSREVYRVALDFTWPLNKVWGGYQMPDHLKQKPCPDCENGSTPAAEWMRAFCGRLEMLATDIAAQRANRPMHPYLAEDPDPFTTRGEIAGNPWRWTKMPKIIRPSDDILPLIAGLTDRPAEYFLGPMPGDCSHTILNKLIQAAGLDPDIWGTCAMCHGHALLDAYEGQSADIEAWEPTEPPAGDGWQLWETVSDGSPISPVFPTADGLAAWMSHLDRGDRWVPQETAARFIAEGWAPTMADTGTGTTTGVEWIGHHTAKEA